MANLLECPSNPSMNKCLLAASCAQEEGMRSMTFSGWFNKNLGWKSEKLVREQFCGKYLSLPSVLDRCPSHSLGRTSNAFISRPNDCFPRQQAHQRIHPPSTPFLLLRQWVSVKNVVSTDRILSLSPIKQRISQCPNFVGGWICPNVGPNPKYQNKHDGILWIQWVLYHGILNIYKSHDIKTDHKCRTSASGRAGREIWASDCAFARSDATTSSDAWRQHPADSRNGSWSGLIQWIWQMDANVPEIDFFYDISEFNSIQKN